jgi:hypothetical protein
VSCFAHFPPQIARRPAHARQAAALNLDALRYFEAVIGSAASLMQRALCPTPGRTGPPGDARQELQVGHGPSVDIGAENEKRLAAHKTANARALLPTYVVADDRGESFIRCQIFSFPALSGAPA